MILLYHILSLVLAFFVVPFFSIYSFWTNSKRRGLPHHFGLVPYPSHSPSQKTLWVFALSLGEVTAAAPVLKVLHEEQPDLRLLVSVTTDSGYDGARQKIPFADQIFFHPLDCLPFTLIALNRIRPDCFVVTDTGFWPGLLDILTWRNTPALLFNGRISARSLRRYQLLGIFSKNLFNRFSVLGMQSQEGKEALQTLGIDPLRLQVIGDPKFDALVKIPEEDRQKIRTEFGIEGTNRVWVAGSTHAGEEEIILDTYQSLKNKFEDLVLIIAPRRLERVDAMESLLKIRKIPFIKRTDIRETSAKQVILLNTMGELGKLYAIANVAFVGNSLLPPGGGHSLMEPVVQGVPVVHGLHVENFRQIAEELKQNELAFPVKDANEMETVMTTLLENSSKRAEFTEKASAWIDSHRGASRRMADIILDALKG
jgi:3-deoxy-D-manno-octulosonic-acid transferase